jgi:hypothetical protein
MRVTAVADTRTRGPVDLVLLSGVAVRRGLKLGVPTPIHRTIAACLSIHQPSGSAKPYTPAHSGVRLSFYVTMVTTRHITEPCLVD